MTTTTAQETANIEVQVEIIRKSITQYESMLLKLIKQKDVVGIKWIFGKLSAEKQKLEEYKNKHPDVFI